MSFINKYSFRCLLGVQSKNIISENEIFSWKVGTKQHFSTSRQLETNDLGFLKSICPSNFHYLSESNMLFLKEHFKTYKDKSVSIIVDINDLSFSGSQFKSIRHCLNKCGKNELTLENNFRDLNDVKKLIKEWSEEYTDKYFRNLSGKNTFFYKNGFHQDCLNLFAYHGDNLVAFGSASPPVNGEGSYIIGKSLYKRFYGLSEWIDVELYKRAQNIGMHTINLGRATKGLLSYKSKFPHVPEIHYNGSIELFI
jgi:phosphatidylglycerol lysyltransferase-like protein